MIIQPYISVRYKQILTEYYAKIDNEMTNFRAKTKITRLFFCNISQLYEEQKHSKTPIAFALRKANGHYCYIHRLKSNCIPTAWILLLASNAVEIRTKYNKHIQAHTAHIIIVQTAFEMP